MKAVILAGGYGTRLAEETGVRPKPMVEIGGMPILWHIMKIYARYGIRDFIICCGYKGYMIKEFFANYLVRNSDIRVDLARQRVEVLKPAVEPWSVTLVDTGEQCGTGGRLRRVREYLGNARFCFTYGDGVADVDLEATLRFHEQEQVLATLTAVQPPARYGALDLAPEHARVRMFKEKRGEEHAWVNGGFFVLEPAALDYVTDDSQMFEGPPMERLAAEGQLAAYRHHGFWRCMDHLSDKIHLEDLWASGHAPWKTW